MNLTEMLILIRRDLKDEDAANYHWTDSELERHIAHALSEISEQIPAEAVALVDTEAGSRDVDVSGLKPIISIEAVEYPANAFPRQYQRFSLWADTLTLLGEVIPDGSDARLFYGKPHALDAAGSTLPDTLADLLALGAEGFACLEWAAFAVNRINIGGTETMSQFEVIGQARLDFFRKELRRLGRRNRVRVASMYVPEESIVDRSVVVGP
jgi:hypothetical protein